MTATAVPSTDALQQIGELQQRATELTQNYHSEFGQIMQQISALATGEQVAASADPSSSGPQPKRRIASTPSASETTATAKPPKRGVSFGVGRSKPRASTPSKKASGGPVKPAERNYSNEMSLKEAVFDVLDRDNWNGILNLPKDTVSLSFSDIKKVVEHEKKWVSSSDDITSQLQGALRELRKKSLVVWKDKRYYVPEGAEFSKA